SLRLGAEVVTCVYRRRIDDMTALPEEISDALAEGCQILPLQAPSRIEADEAGRVAALWTTPQIIGSYGRDGRPSPRDAAQKEFRIPCDYIIIAIGQRIESDQFEKGGIETSRGALKTDLTGYVANTPNVFAGGDAVTGPATVIRAVAAGKVGAANIDAFLGFTHTMGGETKIPPAKLSNTPPCGRIQLKSRNPLEARQDFALATCGMSEEEAIQEASRCLRCDHFGYGIFKGGRTTQW
ncbi:MAG: FAD-dependent oxidoreductase, partial [Gemmiger sp.]|nr:FAD-dependent oxidoreductase [Gemmiger sp.]